MADFHIAVAITLVHEGGYQNDPKDWANWRGGKAVMEKYLSTKDSSLLQFLIGTKYGITAQDMPELSVQQMKDLSPESATVYYAEHYWKQLYAQINAQDIANKLFDMGVLFGTGTAVKVLQTSMESEIHLVSDGVFGDETLADVNQYGNLATYKTVLIQHALNVVQANPNLSGDVNGYISRINS